MALSANRDVDHYVDQELRTVLVKGGTQIFKGGFVVIEEASGYAKPFAAGAGAGTSNFFVGVAYEAGDNINGSDGDVSVRVFTQGDFGHAIAGGTIADVGKKAFASDDDTLSLSAGSGANVFVGRVQDWISGSEFVIRLHGVADADAV
jgi:hypothetical protein